jgi:hypothetical protein
MSEELSPVSLLAEAVLLSTRLDEDWSYDPRTGRYRAANGRFLSGKTVEAIVDGRINSLKTKLRTLTASLIDNSLSIEQWQVQTRALLKTAHIQAALVGNGGQQGMDAAAWGRVGWRLRDEYRYLEGFAKDLLEQRVSAPMALARISLYGDSARGSYWTGTTIRQEKQGYTLMRRILDPQAQHCDDCLRYAAAGMVSMGVLPMPGQRCACRARCRCTVKYYRSQMP